MHADVYEPWGPAFFRRLEHVSRSVYTFREETALAYRVLLVLGFAALTGLSAQVSFMLPFTPVPVTGQVFTVLVASSVLGRWLGPASQGAYVGLGALGVPWFAPTQGGAAFTSGGLGSILSVSGGYLIGFVAASAVIGWVLDRGLRHRSFSANLLVLLAGVGIIYTIGSLQLGLLLGTDLPTTLLYGAVPFLPGDILKAVVAASLLVVALPPEGRTDPAPASSPGLVRNDYLAVGGVLVVVWTVAALIAASGSGASGLEAYYVLSAVLSTGATLAALGLRRARGRSVASALGSSA